MLRREAAVPCMCSILVRRKVIERVGGSDERFRSMYEDQVLHARLLLAAPVYVVDRCWDWYRQHRASTVATAHRNGKELAARSRYLDAVEDLLPQAGGAAGELARAVAVARWECRWESRHPALMQR